MPKTGKTPARDRGRALPAGVLIEESEEFVGRAPVGSWTPNVDLCDTATVVTVRAELPGVEISDFIVAFEDGVLILQGTKREENTSEKLVCYYCVERTYGRFRRDIRIDWVVDPRRARAWLDNGVLTVEIPKRVERRGSRISIPVQEGQVRRTRQVADPGTTDGES